MFKESKFFQSGSVLVECVSDGAVMLAITAPLFLLHAVSPIILGEGIVGGPRLHSPLSAWVPRIDSSKFLPGFVGMSDRAAAALEANALASLNLFNDVHSMLSDPDAALLVLPLGVYVDFSIRAKLEGAVSMAAAIGRVKTIGTAELSFAIAEALSGISGNSENCFIPPVHSPTAFNDSVDIHPLLLVERRDPSGDD